MHNNRRNFIGKSALGIFGILSTYSNLEAYNFYNPLGTRAQLMNDPEINPLYPTEDPAVVREVVGAAHTRFEELKEMVTARPELAKATWDWGFGDVESALGAASHMGRKDIAEFLIEYGSRPNIFTFAMLGKLNAVKAMIEEMPGVQKILGPHGFTLMFHAQMRLRRNNVEGKEKEQQEALVEFLESLGDANTPAPSLDISEAEQKVYLGKYVFGDAKDAFFEVSLNSRGMLFFSRGEYIGRTLLRTDTHSFAPGGAPSVRITFDVIEGMAKSVTVHDPVPIVKAIRS